MRGISNRSLDSEDDQDAPKLSPTDVLLHEYFHLPCADSEWPGIVEVERQLPGAGALMQFVRSCFPRNSEGLVGYEAAMRNYGHDGVNPYMLQGAVNAINLAWAAVADYRALEVKSMTMQDTIHSQAQQMLSRLQQQAREGLISPAAYEKRSQAVHSWKCSKLADVSQQLGMPDREQGTYGAMLDAVPEILRTWIVVRNTAGSDNMQVEETLVDEALHEASGPTDMDQDCDDDDDDDEEIGHICSELDASIVADMENLRVSVQDYCAWLFPAIHNMCTSVQL